MYEPVVGRFFPLRFCGRGVLGDRLVYETGGFYDERLGVAILIRRYRYLWFYVSLFSGA